ILKASVGRVDLDGSGFERGALKVENPAKRMGKSVVNEFKGMGASMVAGFGVSAILHGVMDAVSHIHKLSQEFRVSTDEIQRWDIAAHKVGQDAETVGAAMNRVKKAREAALGGDVKAIEAFGKLGISMQT